MMVVGINKGKSPKKELRRNMIRYAGSGLITDHGIALVQVMPQQDYLVERAHEEIEELLEYFCEENPSWLLVPVEEGEIFLLIDGATRVILKIEFEFQDVHYWFVSGGRQWATLADTQSAANFREVLEVYLQSKTPPATLN